MTALRERLRDPVLWTDAVQIVKTVVAAVIAWVLAREVFGLSQPFLAPWAALLTVHATVYRTVARGAQQVGATVLGVLLAFAAGSLLGVNAASLAIVLLAGMAAGATRRLRAESTTAAATGLVVLLTGSSGDSGMLASRLLDTAIGIGVGLLINLLVWPPLHDRSAARRVDRIDDALGSLLTDMAERLREGGEEEHAAEFVDRTRDLEHDIDAAWGAVRYARESGRLNPRRRAATRVAAAEQFSDLLSRLEQALAETRSLAWTIATSAHRWPAGHSAFRDRWLDLLARTGAAITRADGEALNRVRSDIDDAAREFSVRGDESVMHPERGALLVNLRNIASAMGSVAEAQPVRPNAADAPVMPRRHRAPSSIR